MRGTLYSCCVMVGRKIQGLIYSRSRQPVRKQNEPVTDETRRLTRLRRRRVIALGLVILFIALMVSAEVAWNNAASSAAINTPPVNKQVVLPLNAQGTSSGPADIVFSGGRNGGIPLSAKRQVQPERGVIPADGAPITGGTCHGDEKLSDQQPCYWTVQIKGNPSTNNPNLGNTSDTKPPPVMETEDCTVNPADLGVNWKGAKVIFDCNAGDITDGSYSTFYCLVETDTPLQQLVNIRCSMDAPANGDLSSTSLLSCFYTWTNIGPCDSKCPTTISSVDPVTGIPLPSSDPTATQPVCPIPVQDQCIAIYDPVNDWIFGSKQGLLYGNVPGSENGITFINRFQGGDIVVLGAWKVVAAIALALIAVPFLLAGYQLMRGVNSENQARATESIGRIVLIALAIALSFTIATQLTSLEDGIEKGFVTTFPPVDANVTIINRSAGASSLIVTMPSSNWQCYAQQFFGTLFNMNVDTTNNAASIGQNNPVEYASNMNTASLTLLENLPNYVLTLLSVTLAIQLLIRQALLNVHIIVSPLTILCGAVPGQLGPRAAGSWLRSFGALLAVQVLQVVILVLGSQLIEVPALIGSGNWISTVVNTLLPIAIMIMALNMPRLFNLPATTMLANLTSSFSSAMNGIAMIIRGL